MDSKEGFSIIKSLNVNLIFNYYMKSRISQEAYKFCEIYKLRKCDNDVTSL